MHGRVHMSKSLLVFIIFFPYTLSFIISDQCSCCTGLNAAFDVWVDSLFPRFSLLFIWFDLIFFRCHFLSLYDYDTFYCSGMFRVLACVCTERTSEVHEPIWTWEWRGFGYPSSTFFKSLVLSFFYTYIYIYILFLSFFLNAWVLHVLSMISSLSSVFINGWYISSSSTSGDPLTQRLKGTNIKVTLQRIMKKRREK